MTVAAGDLHPFCIYGSRYRVTFPILDADGDLVTGAAGLDSEKSLDTGTFADCTNEATEIATSSGVYYLDLTNAETLGKNVSVIVKTSTVGAKTTTLSIPIARLPVLRSFTAAAGGASTITLDSGASTTDSVYVGMYVQITNNSPANVLGQTRKIISYVGSTKVATVEAAWGTNPSSASTADILIPETVNTAAVSLSLPGTSADVTTAVWDVDATAHQTQGTFGQTIGDSVAGSSITTLVTTNLDATVSGDAARVWAYVIGTTAITAKQVMKMASAWFKGKVVGGATSTVSYRDPEDTTKIVIQGVSVQGDGTRDTSTGDLS